MNGKLFVQLFLDLANIQICRMTSLVISYKRLTQQRKTIQLLSGYVKEPMWMHSKEN